MLRAFYTCAISALNIIILIKTCLPTLFYIYLCTNKPKNLINKFAKNMLAQKLIVNNNLDIRGISFEKCPKKLRLEKLKFQKLIIANKG